MTVSVHFRTRAPAGARALVPALKKAVRAALGKRAAGEVGVILENDAGIRRLNRRFLSRTGTTDVIAFNHSVPALRTPGVPAFPLGDIYICLPQARRQAELMGHGLATELLILAVHGALHLSGMDDASPPERRAMNRKTLRLLRDL
ncbi:MAG TPA: rRNA maturation RNase YbeY [Elusimicrobiales bacterium]|nr:rRNA maturation RNase YbeY [Elusimicrobiales bacterium]